MHLRMTALALLQAVNLEAYAQVPEAAARTIQTYSSALNAYDCQGMLSLTSPAVLRRADTYPDGRAGMCQAVEAFKAAGVWERLRLPTAVLSSGHYRLILIPNSRTAVDPDQRIPSITEGTYVLHSSDSGGTWHVLDLACVDERWMHEVYPPYRGTPKVEPATQSLLSETK